MLELIVKGLILLFVLILAVWAFIAIVAFLWPILIPLFVLWLIFALLG